MERSFMYNSMSVDQLINVCIHITNYQSKSKYRIFLSSLKIFSYLF